MTQQIAYMGDIALGFAHQLSGHGMSDPVRGDAGRAWQHRAELAKQLCDIVFTGAAIHHTA